MSVNKCLFIGNLTADPEIRTMPNGEQVANFTVALNEKYKAKDGNIVENVEYVRIVLYRRLAEIAGQYLHKGSQVYIEGRLKTRKWQDSNGQDRYTTEIQGDNLQMLGGRQDEPKQAKASKAKPEPLSAMAEQDDFSDGIPFQGLIMSKFIKLTNFRAGGGDLIVNVDLIRTVTSSHNDSSIVKFSDEHNVVVKETPERILKMIETAKQRLFFLVNYEQRNRTRIGGITRTGTEFRKSS